MQANEKLFLQTVGRFVQERIATWLAPVISRIEKIESALTEKDARDGADTADGKALSAADIRALVRDEIALALADVPVSPHVVGCYVDRDGDLFFSFSDGHTVKAGHVVGKDADPAYIDAQIKAASEKYPPPKDGKDGFNLTDFSAECDGDRTLILRFASGDIAKEFKLVLSVPLFRGIWRDGAYSRGDMTVRDGSLFVALKDTATTPGTANSDWQLATKRGRDGKDGKSITGPQGPAGNDGRDGRDLTQLGPDGRKWG